MQNADSVNDILTCLITLKVNELMIYFHKPPSILVSQARFYLQLCA